MKKVLINNVARVLSPFAYKDLIKSLDKSNESRVTIDGVRVFRSAVTSGRDVKSGKGGMKYHVYMYLTEAAAQARDTALREWMPITAEESRAYKNDAGFMLDIVSAPPEPEQYEPEAETQPDGHTDAARHEDDAALGTKQPTKGRRAERAVA